MQTEVIISGFGGQGVLFAGQLMAYAALEQGRHVTWIPSYGPEMRGGTAHCVVIVSDEEIGSPIVRSPTAAVVMNLPSLDRYEPLVKPGGVLIVNASLVDRSPSRTDLQAVMVPAIEIAEELGDKRLANLVMLGALLERLPVLTLEAIEKALRAHIPEHRRHLVEANLQALRRGASVAVEQVQAG
ncbi:MAG: 2-oxoacid:acceptor oxidoreductase family protein [Chloroflexota bacterium]